MRTVEWVVVAYMAYIAALALGWPLAPRMRRALVLVAAADVAITVSLSSIATPLGRILRDWLPAAHILVGYWLSGPFFVSPMPRLEARLARFDRWWFEVAGLRWLAEHGPRAILEILEAAYASAYVMVPLGFALAYRFGQPINADRYWTAVVSAAFLCYGMLPWLQSRTPGALGDHMAIAKRQLTLRGLNRAIQRHGSIQVATVPSGHAASALATALMAGACVPAALGPLLILALAIGLASVVGRYHWMADALLGYLVGAVAVVAAGLAAGS